MDPSIVNASPSTPDVRPERALPPALARITRVLDQWHYPVGEKRDLRLDLLRGFAVLVMVVDHFGGSSWLYLVTGNNQFFTSGAEAFVLISGMVVGMVYGATARRKGLGVAVRKSLERTWTLYKLTVVMTIVFAVVSVWADLPWGRDGQLVDLPLFLLDVILFRQTFYLADIPMMYTLLMLISPIGLWLLVKNRTGLLVFLSTVAWAGFQYVNAQQILILPIIGNTTFHPAAWQLIFFWAMAVGFHRESIWPRLARLSAWRYFAFSALLFVWLIHLYATEIPALTRLYPGIDMQAVIAELFTKSTVAPGRILATVIVFQFAYLFVTLFWKPIWTAVGWFFTPLGQNSLYGYTMHVVIIGVFYLILPYLPGHITERGLINTTLQLGVLFALWLMIRRQFAFDIVPR